MNEVLEFLKKIKVFYLATDENGQPRVRPMGVIEEYNGKLYIQTGKKKNVSKQIRDNNKVEICGFDGNTWLRLEGNLISDDSIEAKEYILDQNPSLKRMYDAHDDNTEVLYFEHGKATFSSFTSEPRVITW